MITETEYLQEKQNFEDLISENNSFLKFNFEPLFKSFNKEFRFNLDLREIQPKSKNGYIVFGFNDKSQYNAVVFVRFSVNNNNKLSLSYTENHSEEGFTHLKNKSKLYDDIIILFDNFDVDAFNNLIDLYVENSNALSKFKRIFLKLEKEYIYSLNKKSQNIFLSFIKTFNRNVMEDKFNLLIEEKQNLILIEYEKRYHFRPNIFYFFGFSFDLDYITFQESQLYIKLNDKNKFDFYLNGKKSSRKKCLELYSNQFIYQSELITNFKDFEAINEFKKDNFDFYSSWESKAKIVNLIKPFKAQIIAKDF
jgi:hypothetical protein